MQDVTRCKAFSAACDAAEEAYHAVLKEEFPVGSMVDIHWGNHVRRVEILGHGGNGRVTVYNPDTGKEYALEGFWLWWRK